MASIITWNNLPIVGFDLPSLYGKEVRQFGTDPAGLPVFYTIMHADQAYVGSLDNPTSESQPMSYTLAKGSELEFSQSASITVEVTGGIDLDVINFGSTVSATGTLGFRQAFSNTKTFQVTANVPPGKSIAIFEGTLLVQYFKLSPMPVTDPVAYFWIALSKDIIDTGAYALVESDLSPTHSTALAANSN